MTQLMTDKGVFKNLVIFPDGFRKLGAKDLPQIGGIRAQRQKEIILQEIKPTCIGKLLFQKGCLPRFSDTPQKGGTIPANCE